MSNMEAPEVIRLCIAPPDPLDDEFYVGTAYVGTTFVGTVFTDSEESKRPKYIRSDLAELTWEDIKRIHDLFYLEQNKSANWNITMEEETCKEVLRRFNELKKSNMETPKEIYLNDDSFKNMTKKDIIDKILELEDIIYRESDYCIADAAMYELKIYQERLKSFEQ